MEKLTNKQIIEHIKTMTALELNDLVAEIEKTFDVKATATVAAQVQSNTVDTKENESQPTSIYLKEVSQSIRIPVIKLVKEKIGLDLGAARNLVDAVAKEPQLLTDKLSFEELKKLEEDFKAIGAVVELK